MDVDLPMPSVRPVGAPPAKWKLTVVAATMPYDCTPHGIATRCGGACCKGPGGWPPRPDGACTRLGPEGCTMGAARPVGCHLYPLRLNGNGTIALAGFTRWPVACKGNRRAEGAPMLIDALRGGLVAIFGPDEWAKARADVLEGRDAYLTPLPGVADDLVAERGMEERGEVPPPSEHRWAG